MAEQASESAALAALATHDIKLIRAPNPGPLTLSGTNTWLVGRKPCWIVDPGPEIDAHRRAITAAAAARGGIGGIVLTHNHHDHAALAVPLATTNGDVQIAAADSTVGTVRVGDGDRIGPFDVVAVSGHSPDHICLIAASDDGGGGGGGVVFSGDAILGRGSVLLSPGPGALSGYLDGLRALKARRPQLLAPGHGPPSLDPEAKIEQYIAHRLERERRIIAALADGVFTVQGILDHAWGEIDRKLRPAAEITLAAHLDKLEQEGRLPEGVRRPAVPDGIGTAATER